MFGLSIRFIFSFLGIVTGVFLVLYGVHKITGSNGEKKAALEQGNTRSQNRQIGRRLSPRNTGSHAVGGEDSTAQAKSSDEEVIMSVVEKAREEVAEQQRAQREKMAPLVEKRRTFFASLEKIEDEQERNRLRAEWMEKQRERRMAARQASDTESARASQRLAGMGMKLQSLRRYDLIPQLKPKADEIRSLMVQYAQRHETLAPDSKNTLWNKIEQSLQGLRRQHQQLMHPDRFR